MKAFELVKINRESMELMSKLDLKSADYQYISLYDEYLSLRRGCQKYWYVITYLSEKYGISESTVKRLVRKFSREVDSVDELFDTILHEMKHATEHISECFDVSPKSEEAAYLQGEIARQMFPAVAIAVCPMCHEEKEEG